MTPRKTLVWTMVAALTALPLADTAFAGHHEHGDEEEAHPGSHHEKRTEQLGGHGWLGVSLQRVEGGLAEALDLDEDSGVLVGQVIEDSPAAEAGLKAGDIVLSVGDDDVGTPTALRDAIRGLDAGDRVSVRYLRDGRKHRVNVTLGESPEPRSFAGRHLDEARRHLERARDLRFGGTHGFLGVVTQSLDGDLGDFFGAEDGALVIEVVEDSPAEELGLEVGDVILEVDGKSVEDPADLRRVVAKLDEENEVEVVWMRDKHERNGTTKLEVREGVGVLGMGDGPHMLEFSPDFDLDDPVNGLRRHAGDARVLVKRFGESGEIREMIEELREQVNDLREELEELKSD